MQIGNWKINVGHLPGIIHMAIYIYRHVGEKTEVMSFNDRGEVTVRTIEQHGSVENPTILLAPEDFDDLVKGFVEYARNRGFKDSNESFVEGKLKATEMHLEDMRDLVFGYDVKRDLKKIINVQVMEKKD